MRLVDLDLTQAEAAELGELLRSRVPEVAAEAIREIEAQLPVFVRPQDPRYAAFLGRSVQQAIGRFVELMAGGDAQLDGLHEFYRSVGALLAEEGITRHSWQAAFRVGTGVAIKRLTEAAEAFPGVTPTAIARVAQAVLGYLDQIIGAMAEGYAGVQQARSTFENRRKLVELLLAEDPRPDEIHRLAMDADWRVPRTIAAVALTPRAREPAHRPSLPAEALPGLHRAVPCLIISDPDGPGRRARLEIELRDWVAAIGPTVDIAHGARSLRWACRALELAAQGHFETDVPVHGGDHTMPMVLLHGREMMEHLVPRLLAPLDTFRGAQRRRLAETLLMCLQNGFNAAEAATRLQVHAQTVRYRMRHLEEAFGPAIHDPDCNLEYQAALTFWLITTGRREPPDHT